MVLVAPAPEITLLVALAVLAVPQRPAREASRVEAVVAAVTLRARAALAAWAVLELRPQLRTPVWRRAGPEVLAAMRQELAALAVPAEPQVARLQPMVQRSVALVVRAATEP